MKLLEQAHLIKGVSRRILLPILMMLSFSSAVSCPPAPAVASRGKASPEKFCCCEPNSLLPFHILGMDSDLVPFTLNPLPVGKDIAWTFQDMWVRQGTISIRDPIFMDTSVLLGAKSRSNWWLSFADCGQYSLQITAQVAAFV